MMANFPHDYRKSLSHRGAIRTVDACHRAQWHCSVIGDCFDPSNFVYDVMWKAIVPSLLTSPWNAETFGDIAETILAVGLGVNPLPEVCFPMDIVVAAQLLEKVAQDLHSVFCFFPAYNDVPQLASLVQIIEERTQWRTLFADSMQLGDGGTYDNDGSIGSNFSTSVESADPWLAYTPLTPADIEEFVAASLEDTHEDDHWDTLGCPLLPS
jgi:hypothetical protein